MKKCKKVFNFFHFSHSLFSFKHLDTSATSNIFRKMKFCISALLFLSLLYQASAGSKSYVDCPLCSDVYRNIVPPSQECIEGRFYIWLHSGPNVISGYCTPVYGDFIAENIDESFDWVEIWYKGGESKYKVSRMSSPSLEISSDSYSDSWSSTVVIRK